MQVWAPTGTWGVGVADLEYAEHGSVQAARSPPADPTRHLSGRVYYPTAPGAATTIAWLPGFSYARGVAKFLFYRAKGLAFWCAQQGLAWTAWACGTAQRLRATPGAPLAATPHQLPVVVFSHGRVAAACCLARSPASESCVRASQSVGSVVRSAWENSTRPSWENSNRAAPPPCERRLGGHRALYAVLCSELASQGYLVLAVEHTDGTASCAKLAGTGTYHLYAGLGGEDAQHQKTRHRVEEMQTGLRVLQAMARGEALPGLTLSDQLDAGEFLRGRLDFRCGREQRLPGRLSRQGWSTRRCKCACRRCIVAAGHSYGGATCTALVAEDSRFRCAVALDPWWHALPPESCALTGWRTRAPVLILGSHDWNTPNLSGQLACGGEKQERVLDAARMRAGAGAGALLLVVVGSSHNTFAGGQPRFGAL